jgi:hypothetical protein
MNRAKLTFLLSLLSIFNSLRVTETQDLSTLSNNTMNNTMNNSMNNSFLLIPPAVPGGFTDEIFKLIPPNFWVDMTGYPGKDYIILRTKDNGFMSCDLNGKMYSSQNFTANSLWIPKFIGKNNENVVYLQNYFGGYMNVNFMDYTVNCFPRVPPVTSIFKIMYALLGGNDLNMILMNEGFLTYSNNTFYTGTIDMSDKSQLFKPVRPFSNFASPMTLWNNLVPINDLMPSQ